MKKESTESSNVFYCRKRTVSSVERPRITHCQELKTVRKKAKLPEKINAKESVQVCDGYDTQMWDLCSATVLFKLEKKASIMRTILLGLIKTFHNETNVIMCCVKKGGEGYIVIKDCSRYLSQTFHRTKISFWLNRLCCSCTRLQH